jgi:riboflavin synthase
MVSGHVDGRGKLDRIEKKDGGWDVYISLPRDLAAYIIPKGSITLDGVSLTVNQVHDQAEACVIRLTLIPATVALTTFKDLPVGWPINVEVDLVGKYLERFASPYVLASRPVR